MVVPSGPELKVARAPGHVQVTKRPDYGIASQDEAIDPEYS
jgi:hypothetical protein